MKKGIYLQVEVDTGGASGVNAVASLPAAFAQANPGLHLEIKKQAPPDNKGKIALEVYIHGEQAPASNFLALASKALKKALLAHPEKSTSAGAKPHGKMSVVRISELENANENEGVILPPSQ